MHLCLTFLEYYVMRLSANNHGTNIKRHACVEIFVLENAQKTRSRYNKLVSEHQRKQGVQPESIRTSKFLLVRRLTHATTSYLISRQKLGKQGNSNGVLCHSQPQAPPACFRGPALRAPNYRLIPSPSYL